MDADSARLAKERDTKRQQDPNDPSLEDLNQRVAASIASASRKRWMDAVGAADRRSNPRRFWSLLKGLSGKRISQAPNQPITFNGKTFSSLRCMSTPLTIKLLRTLGQSVVRSNQITRLIPHTLPSRRPRPRMLLSQLGIRQLPAQTV